MTSGKARRASGHVRRWLSVYNMCKLVVRHLPKMELRMKICTTALVMYKTFVNIYMINTYFPNLFPIGIRFWKRKKCDLLRTPIIADYFIEHRAQLSRGIPMSRSIQIIGGTFRRGLHSKVVTFLTSPCPLYNGEKAGLQHPILYPGLWLAQKVLLLY